MDTQFAVHIFLFSGQAEMPPPVPPAANQQKTTPDQEEEAVKILNEKSGTIAEEIRNRLRTKLPPGTDVEVNIEFVRGSLAWLGQVAFFDIAGGITATAALITSIAKAVEFVITRIVKKHEPRMQTARTTVTPPTVPIVQPPPDTTRPAGALPLKELRLMGYTTIALLVIILGILIYAVATS
jgi:hypothetical protein